MIPLRLTGHDEIKYEENGGKKMDQHVSFSQLMQAEQCPYSYYLIRMAGVAPRDNAFAQAGKFVHSLLAQWAKGEIRASSLPDRWREGYDSAVTELFPVYLENKGYRKKLYDSVMAYFSAFRGFPGYQIVSVEQQFISNLAGERFVGVIDLILKNEETGGYVLVDHKSSSLASFNRSRTVMYRQLLLYAKYLADHFGCFPERLQFNLFRESSADEQPFRPEAYVEAVQWAEEEIQTMKARELPDWFECRPEQFYCTCLCAARDACPFGNYQYHRKEHYERKERSSESIPA